MDKGLKTLAWFGHLSLAIFGILTWLAVFTLVIAGLPMYLEWADSRFVSGVATTLLAHAPIIAILWACWVLGRMVGQQSVKLFPFRAWIGRLFQPRFPQSPMPTVSRKGKKNNRKRGRK